MGWLSEYINMREGTGWWAEGERGGTVTVIGAKAATSVKSFKNIKYRSDISLACFVGETQE